MKRLTVVILVFVLLLSAVSCTSKERGVSEGLEKVRVILDYVPNTNHTGLYVALERGYYEEEGFDVEIMQPSEGTTETLIATGKGEFGISYQEDVTYARTAEEPLPIKAIATVIQHNTSCFASYEPKGIKSPKDFEGKVYTGWGSPAEEAIIRAVMENVGADFSKLEIVAGDDAGFAALEDRIDLTWVYYGWTGIEAKMQGFPMNYIEIRSLDERLDFYTPIIIASEDLIEKEPELIEKFLSATEKGYMDSIEDPEAAADILADAVPEYDREFLRESQKYLSTKYMEDTDRWGEMKESVWDNYTGFMLENGLITRDMPAREAFTNEFLPN